MAYIHIADDSFTLGLSGCGPNCRCAPCRQHHAHLSEWYVKEDNGDSEPGRTGEWNLTRLAQRPSPVSSGARAMRPHGWQRANTLGPSTPASSYLPLDSYVGEPPQSASSPSQPITLRMRSPMTPAPPRGFDPAKAAKEAAEKIVPLRPETPEERLQRILKEPVPTLPPGRSFKEWLDRKLADRRVPKWLRDRIWGAIFDKNWGLMGSLLSAAGFSGGTKESIIETARGASEIKAR